MTADSIIGEGAARESDLLAFQIAIERGKPGFGQGMRLWISSTANMAARTNGCSTTCSSATGG